MVMSLAQRLCDFAESIVKEPDDPFPDPGDRASGPDAGIRKPAVVENTGIEPVTSWLQTRRSPS